MRANSKTVWGQFASAVGIALTILLLFRYREYTLPPPPGVCVAILGSLALVITLVPPKMPSKGQKVLWIISTLVLMVGEIWAISHDRAEQNKSFQAMLTSVNDSIKTQTGGDSFAYISFTAQQAASFEMHWQNFVAPKGKPYFVVSITSRGKYPLRSTHVTMMDDERRLAAMREYNRHPSGDWIHAINSADTEYELPYLRPQSPEAPTGEVDIIGLYPMPETDSKRLTVAFAAPNGYWNEVLHLGHINGVWHQCLSVMGPTVEQANRPYIYCDTEDWPEGKALAEKDWRFPNQ